MKTDVLERKIYDANFENGYANYRRGELFEFKTLAQQKPRSILAIRSSGSRSPIDIVSIRKKAIVLINCKVNGYIKPSERKALLKLKAQLPNFCKIELHTEHRKEIL